MRVEEWLDDQIGIDIWNKKYRFENESFDEWLERVSGGDKEIVRLIKEQKFLFGGRTLSNRNTGKKASYSNCYSSGYVEDSLEEILELNKNLGLTYKAQGGQGLSLSKLRPKGTKINNQFDSDGIIPFMRIFNETTSGVSQGGSRKGALMMSLSCHHKEIMDFITIKTKTDEITKANLSVEIDDIFMEAVKKYYNNGEVVELNYKNNYEGNTVEYSLKPIEIYKVIMQSTYDWGDPGVILTDRFRNFNLMQYIDEYEIVTGNPCFTGDMKLLTSEGYKTFEELNQTEFKVINWHHNETEGKVWITGLKKIIELHLSNGTVIKCTPNHLFMTDDMQEMRANNLLGLQLFTTDTTKHVKVEQIINNDVEELVYDFSEPITHWGIVEGCMVHNCGEQPLPKDAACNLGSINLSQYVVNPYTSESHFNYEEFEKDIYTLIKALDDVLEEGKHLHALKGQREMANNYRNIGLGIMGLGDMFFKLGIDYGSEKSKEVTNTIMKAMFIHSVVSSSGLAMTRGSFPKYSEKVFDSDIIKNHFTDSQINGLKKQGLRNCSLLSIAPAGSIGTMLNITTGIEPAFAISYQRKTESLNDGGEKLYDVYIKSAKEYMEINKTKSLPKYFVTASDIKWKDRIDVQSIAQNHVDTAISSTVNLPQETTIEEIEQLYLYSWQKKLKGITIFRDGCKKLGILTTDKKALSKKEIKPLQLEWGTTIDSSDDLIGKKRKIMSGCGSLHVQAWFDPIDGRLMEIYLSKGSTGGCNSFMIALSRTISAGLRTGLNFDYALDQLKSVPACPSYSVRTATKKDTSLGNSCPVAIANVLLDMQHEIFYELGIEDESVKPQNKLGIDSKMIEKSIKESRKEIKEYEKAKCPECGGNLRFEGGCNSCPDCFYSKCE